VTTGQDALELIACGAQHVALGTVLFTDPDAPQRVREELAVVHEGDAYARAHVRDKALEIAAKVAA
jgi:dihydroorotate dehydrogenase